LMTVAGCASAQSMKAEIPFYFSAGDAGLAPGTYRLEIRGTNSGTQLIQLTSADQGKSVLVLVQGRMNLSTSERQNLSPTLSFNCVGVRCELAAIWTRPDDQKLVMPTTKH